MHESDSWSLLRLPQLVCNLVSPEFKCLTSLCPNEAHEHVYQHLICCHLTFMSLNLRSILHCYPSTGNFADGRLLYFFFRFYSTRRIYQLQSESMLAQEENGKWNWISTSYAHFLLDVGPSYRLYERQQYFVFDFKLCSQVVQIEGSIFMNY